MTDISNVQPDTRAETLMDVPDRFVDARDVFGIDIDMQIPAFSEADERVPDLDPAYVFDPDTTLAILAGFAFNRRVMVQGYHGTGKSSHIEQVAARLKWPRLICAPLMSSAIRRGVSSRKADAPSTRSSKRTMTRSSRTSTA